LTPVNAHLRRSAQDPVMKLLMVLTSHDRLGKTGRKTGFWLEEFAAPYYVFKDAGVDIDLASPKGGQPPIDPKSDEPNAQTASIRRFKQDQDAQVALANTAKLSAVSAEEYDALFLSRSSVARAAGSEDAEAASVRRCALWLVSSLVTIGLFDLVTSDLLGAVGCGYKPRVFTINC
jgi:hypothetical protein